MLANLGSPATPDRPVQIGADRDQFRAAADQLVVRDLVEQAVGRPVDIAAACGLGRRTPEQAVDAVARMRALVG
ncbi:hypothetical protein ACQPXM_26105 [Kribbella sp. CA-253562]|uniref:hypothetical protein n=1 Tax=Kribbella sp. CA-253562 TaxID=3239942 RepID=UPI003D89BBE3